MIHCSKCTAVLPHPMSHGCPLSPAAIEGSGYERVVWCQFCWDSETDKLEAETIRQMNLKKQEHGQ